MKHILILGSKKGDAWMLMAHVLHIPIKCWRQLCMAGKVESVIQMPLGKRCAQVCGVVQCLYWISVLTSAHLFLLCHLYLAMHLCILFCLGLKIF